MEYYLININNFSVIENSNEYNFIKEFYPIIGENYRKLWFLENLSEISSSNKDNLYNNIQRNIRSYLEMYSLPEKVLLIKAGNRYMEPLSKELFRLKSKINLEETTERVANTYLQENKQNKKFAENVKDFKSVTLAENYMIK